MISAKKLRKEAQRTLGPRGQLLCSGSTVEVYRLFWSKLHSPPVHLSFKCKSRDEARLLAYMALQGLPDFVEGQ